MDGQGFTLVMYLLILLMLPIVLLQAAVIKRKAEGRPKLFYDLLFGASVVIGLLCYGGLIYTLFFGPPSK